MSLRDLIEQYPELGDVFADFENRILFLENSQPYNKPEPIPEPEPEPWTKRQWDSVQQLRGAQRHTDKTLLSTLKKIKEQSNARAKRYSNKYLYTK